MKNVLLSSSIMNSLSLHDGKLTFKLLELNR